MQAGKVTYVILSPHFDDAVFNCWHLINQPGTVVMTTFAGVPAEHRTTLWDRICGEANSHQMMQNRRAENETALADMGARIVNLDFLDAQYRGTSVSAIQLADAIIASGPNDAVYVAPLAGSHVRRHGDHVLVRDAALELKQRGRRVTFYPDAPYMRLPKRLTARHIRRLSLHASDALHRQAVTVHSPTLNPALLQGKQRAMRAHASQWRMTNIVSLGGLSRLARCSYEIVFELDDAMLE